MSTQIAFNTGTVAKVAPTSNGLFLCVVRINGRDVAATAKSAVPVGKHVRLREIAGGYVIE